MKQVHLLTKVVMQKKGNASEPKLDLTCFKQH